MLLHFLKDKSIKIIGCQQLFSSNPLLRPLSKVTFSRKIPSLSAILSNRLTSETISIVVSTENYIQNCYNVFAKCLMIMLNAFKGVFTQSLNEILAYLNSLLAYKFIFPVKTLTFL